MANELLLWLGLGSFIGIFVAGRWSLAPAAWIGPVILLHVVHQAPLEQALIGIWAAIAFGILVSHWRVIPLPWFAYPVVVALIAFIAILPYLADRLLVPHLPGLLSTLVFPLTVTAGEYLGARTSPFGTWGSLAYTQSGNRPLIQLASVTGLWGIVFLMAWFASLSLWVWENRDAPDEFMFGVLLYAAILFAVLVWGRMRIIRGTDAKRTVRVATIGWPDGVLELDQLLRAFARDLSTEEREKLLTAFEHINEHFFKRTREAAQAGALIVVWPEANVMVLRAEEEALRARLQELARTHQLYIVAGLAVLDDLPIGKFQNKAVMFTPAGEVAASYIKSKQVPGLETRYSVPGSGRLPVVETPYGRVSLAICYDLDFPWQIRQAGKQRADLLLAPASDWREIGELHHTAAVFRSVENGVALVRAARWGWAAAVTATGREMAVADHYATHESIMLAELPCAGRRTIYARIGDSFAWGCLMALMVLTLWVHGRGLIG